MEIIDTATAVGALLKFAGQYGLEKICISTTMNQRFNSVGTITVDPQSETAFPVRLENVRLPMTAIHHTVRTLHISIRLRQEFIMSTDEDIDSEK